MGWNGAKIRERIGEIDKTIVDLARSIGVTRQAVDAWINGQVPRGQHLVKLCKELGIAPDYFFTSEKESLVTVPQHRTIRKIKVTDEMQTASQEMAEQYINLFMSAPTSSILPVVRTIRRDRESAQIISARLRKLSGISDHEPMDFDHAFNLLNELGIYTVFRPFPDATSKKIYAFYSKICDQRVIFVNTDTNIMDLTFQLLHEAIHAIRDESPLEFDEKAEEDFCDLVANYIQFPENYVKSVAQAIKGCYPGATINKLKDFAHSNHHSLFGIMTRLEEIGVVLKKMGVSSGSVVGADKNLKKEIHTVNAVLFAGRDARTYIDKLRVLSPAFISLVAGQASQASLRKIGEWLGLDNTIDAKSILSELQRIGDAS